MRRLVVMIVLLFSVAGLSASAQEPAPRLLRPSVLPTEHELANPHLYYPRMAERYMAPPELYTPPPPEGSVRPGEFEDLDATIISVQGASGSYGDMWVEMVDTYANSGGHTWIIIADSEKSTFEGLLDTAGVSSSAYSFLNYPFNTIWVRDYGPEFTRDTSGIRYIFDADYSTRPLDDQVPIVMGAGDWLNSDGSAMDVDTVEHGLSGGNVMSDGAGTCFFSNIVYGYEAPTGWDEGDVNDLMAEYLGCEQIITLNSICLDPTGHIDLYAKLMDSTSILLAQYPADTHFDGTVSSGVSSGYCSSPGTPNDYQDQEDNLATIQATTALDGTPWTVTRLQLPEPYYDSTYGWIYRSYMNSEIMNNWVAMPSFYDAHGDETASDLLDLEAAAIAAYETARPGVNVVAIDVDHMSGSGGAIHCISHDIPAEAGGAWVAPTEYCGDGVINGDEECDGEDVGDITCADFGEGFGAYVTCSPDCTYDTSECAGEACGNGRPGLGRGVRSLHPERRGVRHRGPRQRLRRVQRGLHQELHGVRRRHALHGRGDGRGRPDLLPRLRPRRLLLRLLVLVLPGQLLRLLHPGPGERDLVRRLRLRQ